MEIRQKISALADLNCAKLADKLGGDPPRARFTFEVDPTDQVRDILVVTPYDTEDDLSDLRDASDASKINLDGLFTMSQDRDALFADKQREAASFIVEQHLPIRDQLRLVAWLAQHPDTPVELMINEVLDWNDYVWRAARENAQDIVSGRTPRNDMTVIPPPPHTFRSIREAAEQIARSGRGV